MEKNNITFKVNTLKSKKEIANYNQLIASNWDCNPFYCFEYLVHYTDKNHELIVFELWKESECTILMPMLKRRIAQLETDQPYYDVVSPYSYSGPLYKTNINRALIGTFWNHIDQWYKEHNIVTEFVRFSLNDNHIQYTGEIVPTLNNVCGTILKNQVEQWNRYTRQVRNNYRKAVKNNLYFQLADGENISEQDIATFYTIYIRTMERNKALKVYFFSLDYFLKLIFSKPEKFVLCFSGYKDEYVSTELLINHNNILYAHLGGTKKEHFQFRPNDFLRVELIKWASKNGLEKYVLGGGMTNGDGLYKHKKSLFPKATDLIFYTGRKIINEELYKILNQSIEKEYKEEDKDTYFPKYRNPSLRPLKVINILSIKDMWKQELSNYSDYDLYHTFDYHKANLNKGEIPLLFTYHDTDCKIALPLIKRSIENTSYYDATSVYGYGGPISYSIKNGFDNSNFIASLQQFLKNENIISVFSRLHPFIANQETILNNIGELDQKGDVIFIDLSQTEEEIISGYQSRNRSQINKSKKECTVYKGNSNEDLEEFINIYNENMDRVNASKEYYFSKEYYTQLRDSSEFDTDFLFVQENESQKVIGAGILFKKNGIAQYHLSGARESGLHLSPAKLLIDEMWRIAKREGLQYFNLGGGFGGEHDSLFRFKSLFSKNYKPFYVWKYIANSAVYKKLVGEKGEIKNPAFFPLYRG